MTILIGQSAKSKQETADSKTFSLPALHNAEKRTDGLTAATVRTIGRFCAHFASLCEHKADKQQQQLNHFSTQIVVANQLVSEVADL